MPLHHTQSDEVVAQPVIRSRGQSCVGSSRWGVMAATALSVVMLVAAIGFFLANRRDPKRPPADRVLTNERRVIRGDFEAVNQNGETVRLSDLRGKVWAVAEFFAICPICSRRNSTDLRALAKRFARYPDFHLVCISIDPEADGVKTLAGYARAFGARADKWWFLTGDHEEVHRYLEDELLFPPVRERDNEAEAAQLGRYLHDLGIVVVDRQMRIIGKRDLAWAANQSRALRDEWERHFYAMIETELRKPAP